MFSFPGLRPGPYTIEIDPADGFDGILVKDLEIEARTSNELNISLEASSVYEELLGVVAHDPGIVEIDPSVVNNPPSKEIVEMPVKIAPAGKNKKKPL